MAGESYTTPSGRTVTVPVYTDAADAPVAFKDFADSLGEGGSIDLDSEREGQLIQGDGANGWTAGMALQVVDAVPEDTAGEVGDVVFVLSDPKVEEPGLPGLGGWADVTAVTGDSGNRYTYKDTSGFDWVAYEWTDDGTITTTDGLLDMLLVSGGGAGSSNSTHSVYGTCGRVEQGINYLSGTQHDVKVGAGGQWAVMNGRSYPSSCGPHTATFVGYGQPTYGSGATDPSVDINPVGIRSSITGPDTEYAPGNTASSTHGHVVGQPGRDTDRNGFRGVVIVRVPAANALATIPGTWGDL